MRQQPLMSVVGNGRDTEILHASEVGGPVDVLHYPIYEEVGDLRHSFRYLVLRNPGNDGAGRFRSVPGGRHLHLFIPAYTVNDVALIGICVIPSYMVDKRDLPVTSQANHTAHLNSLQSQPVCVR